MRKIPLLLTLVSAALGLSGCGVLARDSPPPSICNGISTEIAPCGSGPTFVATTCDALASEYGTVLDRALVDVINGPDDVGGEGRSVRLIHAEVVATTALTDRMIAAGLITTCKMPDFLDAAQARFSAELRAGVGATLFDGQPVATYDDFLVKLAKVMSGIGNAP